VTLSFLTRSVDSHQYWNLYFTTNCSKSTMWARTRRPASADRTARQCEQEKAV